MAKDPKIPAYYQTVMPYLLLNDAAKFISFTENVFGAAVINKQMRDEKIIMHAEVMIGESIIMLADATETYKARSTGLFIYVDDADIRYKKAIDAGATRITDVSDQPYGRSGGVTDPFGNDWWITSLK